MNSTADYYPFGLQQPGRNDNISAYRYGTSGMESDDEVTGNYGNSYDFGARMYDSRIGRWSSLDYITKAERSDYIAFRNNPILFIDPSGEHDYIFDEEGNFLGVRFTNFAPRFFIRTYEYTELASGQHDVGYPRETLQKSFWDLQDEILDLPTYWLDYMYRDYMRFKTKKFGVHYKYPNELSALSGQKWYRKLNQAHADFLNNGGWYLVGFAYGPAFSFISGGLPATAIRLMRIGAVTRMVVDASSQYITKGKIDWVSVGVSGLPKVGVMWRLILESMDAVIDFSIDDGVETIWYGKDMDEVLTDFGFGSILGTLDEIDATSFFKYASSIDETLSAETLENILTGMNGLFRYFMEANVGEAIKGENEVKTEDYNGDSDTREHSVRNL